MIFVLVFQLLMLHTLSLFCLPWLQVEIFADRNTLMNIDLYRCVFEKGKLMISIIQINH